MDPRQEHALDQVLELTLLLTDDMNRSFERDGLTPARAHLLWVLRGGPSTQRALADALRVSPRNITGLVDGLEASGLVVRRPHPTDRRATLVGFTDDGARLAAEMARGQVELATGLFGPLTEAEVGQLSTLLGGVIDRLKAMIAEAEAEAAGSGAAAGGATG
ncbi:MAG TPA: MarR family transcriptional regulator [Actinomycetes bacterium]